MATLPAQTKQQTSTMTADCDIAMGSHHQLVELTQPKLACQPPCVAPTGEAQRRGGEARIALALQRNRQGSVVQLPLLAVVLQRSGHNVVDVLAVALACRIPTMQLMVDERPGRWMQVWLRQCLAVALACRQLLASKCHIQTACVMNRHACSHPPPWRSGGRWVRQPPGWASCSRPARATSSCCRRSQPGARSRSAGLQGSNRWAGAWGSGGHMRCCPSNTRCSTSERSTTV